GGGHAAFLHALLNSSINDHWLRQPPNTAARKALKRRSLPPAADWWLERLQDGRILMHDKEWKGEAIRTALYADYIQAVQTSGSQRLTRNQFGVELRKFCASLKSGRKDRTGPRTYVLPALDVARREFETYLNDRVEWDDAPPSDPSDAPRQGTLTDPDDPEGDEPF
ncbi:MAG TPA: hypothetical protein VH762_03245, partial [Gemmatimonadaceae bacterium]